MPSQVFLHLLITSSQTFSLFFLQQLHSCTSTILHFIPNNSSYVFVKICLSQSYMQSLSLSRTSSHVMHTLIKHSSHSIIVTMNRSSYRDYPQSTLNHCQFPISSNFHPFKHVPSSHCRTRNNVQHLFASMCQV